jgi:endonuclease/exonuclease/phosphatase family metal-dependent hydrolase
MLLQGVLLALWLPNASRAGSRVEDCDHGCAACFARREGSLRVVSLNALHGFSRFEHLEQRLELVAAEIRRLDAGVVLLQEVPWTLQLGPGAAYLAERTERNHLYFRANGNRRASVFEEGEAIPSRYPLREPVSAELEPRAGHFEQRVVLGATVVTPWGELPAYTTHLTNGAAEVNRAQAEALVNFVSAYGARPAPVAGDLNAPPGSPQMLSLRSRWIDDAEKSRAHDLLTCRVGDLTEGPGGTLEQRTDYLFLVPGQGVAIQEYERVLDEPLATDYGWQWASDRVGLLITMGIER